MCFAQNDGVCGECKAKGELVKFGNGWVCEDCHYEINNPSDDGDMDGQYYDDSMDGDFDSAMASAGYGTDEDYNHWDSGFDYDFNMHTEGE